MEPLRWSGAGWEIQLSKDEFNATSDGNVISLPTTLAEEFGIRKRWFRFVVMKDGEIMVRFPRMKRPDADAINSWLEHLPLLHSLDEVLEWRNSAEKLLAERIRERRWIGTEDVQTIMARRPPERQLKKLISARLQELMTGEQRSGVTYALVQFEERVRTANEVIATTSLEEDSKFFETIERTPLTEEQARAVLCFDNRVQLLAAAGSGKTSVMVARAAYAVHREFVEPDRILLLAFNKAAAEELQGRIEDCFAAAGIDAHGVKSSTFHSFGFEVIGQATGRKPRLASWLEQGKDVDRVLEIVDRLRDASVQFRHNWDLYRLLFAGKSTDPLGGEPDGYDSASGVTGYRTCSGDLVKSRGEQLIADFLFFNGVDFEYERPFVHDVADATHSQYRPDFYYPGAEVWHEHWALDRDGRAPAKFKGYEEDMRWKRSLHASHGTRFVESTFGQVMFEDGLARLQGELEAYGISFDWNPDRPIANPWIRPLQHSELARLVRTFMCHVKSNTSSVDRVESRLQGELNRLSGFRTRLFLSCFWPILEEWQRRLSEEESVDFEDMLVRAGEILEEGKIELPYELILVDEFQDSSRARARLVRGLLRRPGRFLLAVGDDWQAINRFAGADVSVMTTFDEWFGANQRLALTKTFRCSQEICDVARDFVSKNPAQFKKVMQSANGDANRPVKVIFSDDERKSVRELLSRISDEIEVESHGVEERGHLSVDVLGRYGFQRDVVPSTTFDGVSVTFRTVHGAKGLEADYVIVPGMCTGTYGFPSNVADDPVLELAMPTPETYPHAEERRLFYVALTRARRGVFIITSLAQPSPFVVELLKDKNVVVENPDGRGTRVCPECSGGTLVERFGPYDPFLGCTRFPACHHKEKVPCAVCGSGTLVRRHGPHGPFIGCSGYPRCRYTANFVKH